MGRALHSNFKMLGMEPLIISQSPNKENLFLSVKEKEVIQTTFKPFLNRLQAERCGLGRVIIFGQCYEDVVAVYDYFRPGMKEGFF